jgi:hypothetical protein
MHGQQNVQIKNQFKSSNENEKKEALKRKPMHEQFYGELEYRQEIKKNAWCVYVAQAWREKRRV